MGFYNHGKLINADDTFNDRNERNRENTSRVSYNCAGWALETFSWYCPDRKTGDTRDWDQVVYGLDKPLKERARILLNQSVRNILKDFKGKVRRIHYGEKLKPNEYMIGFRLTNNLGDFHFVKQEGPDLWSHKPGGSSIQTFPTEDLFKPWWNGGHNYYNRKIVFLAVKRGT